MITTRNLLASVATAALIAGAAGAANADLQIIGGTAGNIPQGSEDNDLLNPLFSVNTLGGFYGASINLTETSNVTFSFLGWEAGFINSFWFDDGTGPQQLFVTTGGINTTPGDPDVTFNNVAPGLLQFRFDVDGNADSVTNAGNPDDEGGEAGGAPNFFASFGPGNEAQTAGAGPLYLFLDDGGGGNDDNHDDFGVSLTAVAVPEEVAEPVTLGILGLGLAGIGLMARRRRLV